MIAGKLKIRDCHPS